MLQCQTQPKKGLDNLYCNGSINVFYFLTNIASPDTAKWKHDAVQKLNLPIFARSCVRPLSKFTSDSVSHVDQSLATVAQGSVVVTVDAMASYQSAISRWSLKVFRHSTSPCFSGKIGTHLWLRLVNLGQSIEGQNHLTWKLTFKFLMILFIAFDWTLE